MHIFFALIAGILFGAGLTLSGMSDPMAVLGFLDVYGKWDARLMFVMGSALLPTLITFHFILKRKSPMLQKDFNLPLKKHIDKPLIVGACMFGVGWGISGYCPGPAITSLIINPREAFWFIGAMVLGMNLHYFTQK